MSTSSPVAEYASVEEASDMIVKKFGCGIWIENCLNYRESLENVTDEFEISGEDIEFHWAHPCGSFVAYKKVKRPKNVLVMKFFPDPRRAMVKVESLNKLIEVQKLYVEEFEKVWKTFPASDPSRRKKAEEEWEKDCAEYEAQLGGLLPSLTPEQVGKLRAEKVAGRQCWNCSGTFNSRPDSTSYCVRCPNCWMTHYYFLH